MIEVTDTGVQEKVQCSNHSSTQGQETKALASSSRICIDLIEIKELCPLGCAIKDHQAGKAAIAPCDVIEPTEQGGLSTHWESLTTNVGEQHPCT